MSLLQIQEIGKRFPGVVALEDVSFSLERGEIHALCGENGAGKSTLIRILSGIYPAGSYTGTFFWKGQPAAFRSVRDSAAAGIAVIHQELSIVPEMSVAENLFLGNEPVKGWMIDRRRLRSQARVILGRLGLAVSLEMKAGDLGIGNQQLIEIGRALCHSCELLILDEPTAALNVPEAERLGNLLRELKANGTSSLYISHRLGEVKALADKVTVLRDGKWVATWNAPVESSELIRAMVGRDIVEFFPKHDASGGERVLALQDFVSGPLQGVDLRVHEGEIVGLGGLMGAGRTELLLRLAGVERDPGRSGEILAFDENWDPRSPREAMAKGVVYVTEDRKTSGLITSWGIGHNLTLSSLTAMSRSGWIQSSQERAACVALMKLLQIKANHCDVPVETLSGGNQQKVLLGRAMMARPRLLLLDEPTRGVDVGAKAEIYHWIQQLASEGMAILLASSDMPELLGLSDRVYVMSEGKTTAEFCRGEANEEDILRAALSASPLPSHF